MKILLCVALSALSISVAAGSSEASNLVLEGNVKVQDGAFDEAVAMFDKAIQLEPTNTEAILGKMDAFGQSRQMDKLTSLAKNHGKADTVNGLVVMAYQKAWARDQKGAKADLQKALAMDANSYLAHYLSGYLEYVSRNRDGAIPHLEKALQKKADFAEAHYLLGDIYRAKNETDKLVNHWSKYLSLVPAKGKRYEYVNSYLSKLRGR